ncbi:hypothetical protein COOONC_16711 [Cooperia oncophora]
MWFNDDWDPCDQTDDIAIIELAEDARTRGRTPICLPDAVVPLDKHLRAFGSGGKGALSNKPPEGTLSEAELHLFAERASLKTFQTLSKVPLLCRGDSGGPVFQLNSRARFTVVGVTAGGRRDCGKKSLFYINNFADVRYDVEWICKQTGQ